MNNVPIAPRSRIGRAGLSLLAVLAAVPAHSALSAEHDAKLDVRKSSITGLASFITAADGDAIPVRQLAGRPQTRPEDFIATHGHLFGIRDLETGITEIFDLALVPALRPARLKCNEGRQHRLQPWREYDRAPGRVPD